MRNKIVWVLAISFFVLIFSSGCANLQEKIKDMNPTKIVSTLIGAGVGAAIDDRNRWRGGAIGAAAGFLAGMTLEEMLDQATEESIETGERVEYEDDSGNTIEVIPEKPDTITKCRKVTRIVTINGEKDVSTEEICESEKTTYTY